MKIFYYLFVVSPELCMRNCNCFHNFVDEKNVFDCKNRNFTEIPAQLQYGTEWLILSGNHIQKVCGTMDQLENISRIELQDNNIFDICTETEGEQFNSVVYIDLSNNKFNTVPEIVQNLANTTSLKIGNNPYKCDCTILKVTEWLRGVIEQNILDYNDVVCVSGKRSARGMSLARLTERNLGCIPLPTKAIKSACVTVVGIVTSLLFIFRYIDVIKFKLFDKFNIRLNETENIEDMKFDALVAYR